jgi:hypothetical protein
LVVPSFLELGWTVDVDRDTGGKSDLDFHS